MFEKQELLFTDKNAERFPGWQIDEIVELGRRDKQQDAHALSSFESEGKIGVIAAVADGHGTYGASASKLAAAKSAERFSADAVKDDAALKAAMEERFKSIHEDIILRAYGFEGGTTLTIAVIMGRDIKIGYVGDSEARMLNAEGHFRELTPPHRPYLHPGERDRLTKLGQDVTGGYIADPKKHYHLSVSGVLGDAEFQGIARNQPEYISAVAEADERFLIIASDGFWDEIGEGSEDLAEILKEETTAQGLKRKIQELFPEGETRDNMTVLIIEFPPEK